MSFLESTEISSIDIFQNLGSRFPNFEKCLLYQKNEKTRFRAACELGDNLSPLDLVAKDGFLEQTQGEQYGKLIGLPSPLEDSTDKDEYGN
ncbi:MAG: hypothetical protein LBT98_01730 [Puniceicoccales bacterium]|nr:hypothetical protein [Puniceicoccales bacterium]